MPLEQRRDSFYFWVEANVKWLLSVLVLLLFSTHSTKELYMLRCFGVAHGGACLHVELIIQFAWQTCECCQLCFVHVWLFKPRLTRAWVNNHIIVAMWIGGSSSFACELQLVKLVCLHGLVSNGSTKDGSILSTAERRQMMFSRASVAIAYLMGAQSRILGFWARQMCKKLPL